ncbi:MAG: GerMN domain-containing protein [Eubacteriales bacterium]|nr:GerMN domain-containing protein [Eubacteriales bacterium]
MHSKIRKLSLMLASLIFSFTLSACSLVPSNNSPNDNPNQTTSEQQNPDPSASGLQPTNSDPGATPSGDNNELPTLNTLAEYFPLLPDVFYDYGGSGNEYVPMTVWTEYISADTIQFSQNNGGTEVHRLYQIKDGQVLLIRSLAEIYVSEDLRDLPSEMYPEVILQEPLEVGTTWAVDGQQRSISATDVRITTPAGTFFTIEVTTEDEDTTTRQYYAPGIGLVKMTVTGDYEIEQWLISRREPLFRTVPLTLYYGRLTQTDSEILTTTIDAEYRTNLGLKEQLTRYFREPALPNMPALMSQHTIINAIQYDPASGIAVIDFSSEFVTEMNAGSSFESVIIRCIVNTVGIAYGTEKVIINIEGRPYESGHIALGPGEYFGVDTTDVILVDSDN